MNEVSRVWKSASDQGHASAQCNLGVMSYGSGLEGGEKDNKEARHWLQKAADRGIAKAQYTLGRMILNGEGGKANRKLALRWIKKAAKQGHAPAQRDVELVMKK